MIIVAKFAITIYHGEAIMYDLVSVECNEHSRAITEYSVGI